MSPEAAEKLGLLRGAAHLYGIAGPIYAKEEAALVAYITTLESYRADAERYRALRMQFDRTAKFSHRLPRAHPAIDGHTVTYATPEAFDRDVDTARQESKP